MRGRVRPAGTVLSIVLSRIYTLRNQLVHGGATWDSSVNREQLRDCVAKEPVGLPSGSIGVTLSVGLAHVAAGGGELETLRHHAG